MRAGRAWGLALCCCAPIACGHPEEAPRIRLPVVADPSATVAVTNDLGYAVELTEARAIVENFTFTIAGEVHASSPWRSFADFLLPTAHAHPGHFHGGEVTGELRGRFVLQWLPESGAVLGEATLLPGIYRSANFTFAPAGIEDGLGPDDPLLGHTALLRGTAVREGVRIEFVAILDSPEWQELVGALFSFEVRAGRRERLGVRLATRDPLEGDSLFDGIDFVVLDMDGDGSLVIAEAAGEPAVIEAYHRLRRTFQTHDHFDIQLREQAQAVAPVDEVGHRRAFAAD